MCKVFAMAGISEDKTETAFKLSKAAAQVMGKNPDDDGVGYAAITNEGKIFGEKWLKPEDAFILRKNREPSFAQLFIDENLGDAAKGIDLKWEKTYTSFGDLSKKNKSKTTGIILHTRKKTHGDISLKNTHPFYVLNDKNDPDTALIHNGTITNHHQLTKKMSECDSETILHEYLKYALSYEMENIDKVAKNLRGSYVVAMLTNAYDSENEEYFPALDLFRSGFTKTLYFGWVEELETIVFATSKYILEDAVKKAELTLYKDTVGEFEQGYFVRIDAVTGERYNKVVKFTESFTSGTTHYQSFNETYGPRNNVKKFPTSTTNTSKQTKSTPKQDFEEIHADLFEDDYYDIGQLSPEEMEAFKAIESQSSGHNVRALELVKRTFGLQARS